MPYDIDPFTLRTTADRVYRRFHDMDIDEAVKNWANRELKRIQGDLDQVLRFDDGFEDHLLDYIPREVEKFRADSIDDIPYDEIRERPICTCDDLGCKLKAGRLPHVVRDADSIQQGIKQFKQEHDGSPEVLIDGAEDWYEKRREVWYILRHIETHLTVDREEPPEGRPGAGDVNEPATAD